MTETANAPNLDVLFGAIAAGDRARVSALLDRSPALATTAAVVGATRQDEARYFLDAIRRHVYAGDTPLHVAAAAHDDAVTKRLLDRGADPNAANRRGATPLHSASAGSPGSSRWNPDAQTSTIALLIGAGARVDAADKDGATALHIAVRTRCAAATRALIDGGADARRGNRSGSTPLHLAVQTTGRAGVGSEIARHEQAELIRVLLAHGARPTDRDARGRTVVESIQGDHVRALLSL